MTVDVSTLKVGDTVILRNGTERTINYIKTHKHSPLVYLGWEKVKASYSINGRWPIDTEHPYDIVKIIPAKEETVKESNTSTKEEFKKFDSGKPDLSFTDPILEQLYAEASTVGAKKYGRGNYINFTLADVPRFYAAMRRHGGGYRLEGKDHGFLYEECDPIDGQKHLASLVWCATRLQEAINRYGYEAVIEAIRGFKPEKKG